MTRQTSTRVSFVIPVRNDARRLKTCLDAIARNQHSEAVVEVIVADNDSSDDSREVATAAGARVLRLPGLRVSALRNRAAAAATGDLLAFVDADHVIAPTWIASAEDVLAADGVGAAGALYSVPVPGSWVQRLYGALRGRSVGRGDVTWLGSGNLVVRRAAFDTVGGFDASLEACEDIDFCQRLRRAGWRVVADEHLRSVHLGDPATLGALFRAERWRGRDNLRVTLRGPLAARDLPSLFIPIIDVTAVLAALGGLVAAAFFGSGSLTMALAGVLVIVGLAALRAFRIVASLRDPLAVGQAFLVALTYDLARAVALVTRAPHHGRTSSNRSPAGASLR
jgi:hypothetical protein